MIYLLCYDITDDKLRKKVSDRFIRLGLSRIQYSVFMGTLKEHLKKDLVSWLKMKFAPPIQKGERRNILIFNLTQKQLSDRFYLGAPPFQEAEIMGKLNTLYFG